MLSTRESWKLYAVTLWHAGTRKRVRYLVTAGDHTAAIRKTLDHTAAPMSAVMMWEEATPKETKRMNGELGYE